MNPVVIIGPIVGNICAIAFYSLMNCGLVGPASPGSVIAFLGMAPKDQVLIVLLGIVISATISFVISGLVIRATDGKGKSLEEAKKQKEMMKARAKGITTLVEAKMIIFACDAGMGSSAMGATKFRNRLKELRSDIVVKHSSVDTIPADADIVVVQEVLQERARAAAPQAHIIVIQNFLADPELDMLYEQLAKGKQVEMVLVKESIRLKQASATKEEAIRQVGELLVARGCVEPAYVDSMLEREKLATTYMGMGIAIPHGTSEAKASVKKTGIAMIQYPEGIEFGEEKAYLVFGIAGVGEEHLELLGKIAGALDNPEVLEKMKNTDDVDWILETLL